MAGVGEVAADVGQPRGEALEDLRRSTGFAGALDRFAGVLAQVLERPVVARDADDRAVEQPPLLEPVQRAEGHHLREVAGDPEDHEYVGALGLAGVVPAVRGHRVSSRGCWAVAMLPPVLSIAAVLAALLGVSAWGRLGSFHTTVAAEKREADGEARTRDLILTMDALYQLSYVGLTRAMLTARRPESASRPSSVVSGPPELALARGGSQRDEAGTRLAPAFGQSSTKPGVGRGRSL